MVVVSAQPTATGGIGFVPEMGSSEAPGGCVDCHDYFEIHV